MLGFSFKQFCLYVMTGFILAGIGTSQALAACKVSAADPPRHFIGLQILHAEDMQAWQWVKELDVEWLRVEIHWKLTEPVQGQYNWTYTEAALKQSHASRRHILLLINSLPDWVVGSGNPEQAFSAFLQKLYERYPQEMAGIDAYEIFNEPNNSGYGWPAGLTMEQSAALFAHFLKAANQGIRAHDENAVLVSGGLMKDGFHPLLYAREVFRHDVVNCIDVVGFHPYGYDGKLVETQEKLQEFFISINVRNKPVWFTEYGTTDNDDRAKLLRDVFANKDKVNGMIWFLDRDFGIFGETYGLIDYFGVKKPDFDLFRELEAKSK